MKGLLPIIKILALGVVAIAFLSILAINGLMAYIMFAPDDLPKPFYLAYQNSGSYPFGSVAKAAPEVKVVYVPAEDTTQGHLTVPVSPGEGVMFNTGTKIVNLADPTGRKYLKVTVVLEFEPNLEAVLATEGGGEEGEGEIDPVILFQEEMNERLPVINDLITTVLSSKTFEDIYTVAGKEALRQEIMDEINEKVTDQHVISVYFTEFIVQ